MARGMGLDIPEPLTWREFAEGRYYSRGIKGVVIDDLDTCIEQMATVPVRAVSLTDADAPVPVQ